MPNPPVGFDDGSLQQAESALIAQLNNLSHALKKPISKIWQDVLEHRSNKYLLYKAFDNEEHVADVANATVRALCLFYMAGEPIMMGQVWDAVKKNDDLNGWFQPGFSVRVFDYDKHHLGTLKVEEEEQAYWIQNQLMADNSQLSVMIDPLPE